jgi:hypothetical protein
MCHNHHARLLSALTQAFGNLRRLEAIQLFFPPPTHDDLVTTPSSSLRYKLNHSTYFYVGIILQLFRASNLELLLCHPVLLYFDSCYGFVNSCLGSQLMFPDPADYGPTVEAPKLAHLVTRQYTFAGQVINIIGAGIQQLGHFDAVDFALRLDNFHDYIPPVLLLSIPPLNLSAGIKNSLAVPYG